MDVQEVRKLEAYMKRLLIGLTAAVVAVTVATWTCRARAGRSSRTGSETHGDSPLTRRRATSTSATSARTRGRRSSASFALRVSHVSDRSGAGW